MSARRQYVTMLWLLLCVFTLSITAQTPATNSSASGTPRARPPSPTMTPLTTAADEPPPTDATSTTTTSDLTTATGNDLNAPSDASPSVTDPSTPTAPSSTNGPSDSTAAELTTATSDPSTTAAEETTQTTPAPRTPTNPSQPSTPSTSANDAPESATPMTDPPTAAPPSPPAAPVTTPNQVPPPSPPPPPSSEVTSASSTGGAPALDPSAISSVYGTMPPDHPEGAAGGNNSKTESNASASSPGWIVPVVVAAVVMLALLVITFYVRTRTHEEPDDLDRPSEHFFEAPRTNASNYANAAGGGGAGGGNTPLIGGGMTADEWAQKEAVLAMRKPSGPIVAAPVAAGPPMMPRTASALSQHRQDPVLVPVEPQFTLQEEVELERSQRSMHITSTLRSPQAAVSPVSQSFETDPSFHSTDYMASGASVPGVTL